MDVLFPERSDHGNRVRIDHLHGWKCGIHVCHSTCAHFHDAIQTSNHRLFEHDPTFQRHVYDHAMLCQLHRLKRLNDVRVCGERADDLHAGHWRNGERDALLNIHVCHRCDLRQKECAGPCACTVDGRDIIEHVEAGDCPEGKFSAQPTRNITEGIKGLALALTGLGGASDETIRERTEICGKCPHAVMVMGVLQQCSICGCATWAKIRNEGEKCPDGRW